MSFEDEPDVLGTITGALLPLHIYLLNEIYQTTHDDRIAGHLLPACNQVPELLQWPVAAVASGHVQERPAQRLHRRDNLLGIDDYHCSTTCARTACRTGSRRQGARRTPFAPARSRSSGRISWGARTTFAQLRAWIEYLADALQTHAWDESCATTRTCVTRASRRYTTTSRRTSTWGWMACRRWSQTSAQMSSGAA